MPLLASALTWAVGGKRRTAGKPSTGPHRPSACRDRSCQRPLCEAYKQGREDGYEDGYDDGWADGYRAGAAAAGGR